MADMAEDGQARDHEVEHPAFDEPGQSSPDATLTGRKLTIVAGGTRLTASTRHRLWHYRSFLEADGLDLRWIEYGGGRRPGRLGRMKARLRFLADLKSASWGETILVQKVLPPTSVLRRWSALGRRIVYDFDDALFERFTWGESAWAARTRRRRLDSVLREVDAVTAGSRPLAEYASRHVSDVHVVYPSLLREEFEALRTTERGSGSVLGWIGNDQSQVYLRSLASMLHTVMEMHPGARLMVCTSVRPAIDPLVDERTDFIPWSEENQRAALEQFDIAISPMGTDAWSLARGGRVSVLQSMAAGLPVVAAPGGGLEDLLVDGVGGFLVTNDQEWVAALDRLIGDRETRVAMGAKAQEAIAANVWADVQYPRFRQILFPE